MTKSKLELALVTKSVTLSAYLKQLPQSIARACGTHVDLQDAKQPKEIMTVDDVPCSTFLEHVTGTRH